MHKIMQVYAISVLLMDINYLIIQNINIGVVSLKEKLCSFKWNQPLVGEKRVLPLKGSYQIAHKVPVCF